MEALQEKDRWDLSGLYENDNRWREDFERLAVFPKEMEAFAGQLQDAKKLLAYLKKKDEADRLVQKLWNYAMLHADEDTSNMNYLSMRREMEGAVARIEAAGAFFVPELLALSDEKIAEMLEQEEELRVYTFALQSILRNRKHYLNAGEEKLLAYASECLSAPQNVSDILRGVDMKFPSIRDEKGEERELNEGSYPAFLMSTDRRVRKEAFESVLGTYTRLANTFGGLLISSVKNSVFNARIRNYATALECSLGEVNIPVEVYHTTIASIGKGIGALQKYIRLKKQILGLDELHMYDINVPLFELSEDYVSFDDAVVTIKEALQPLGEDYVEKFQEGIDSRWIDRYPRMGKVGGAYSAGCYDSVPYILLNYNGKQDDVLTLAHEMGHSMNTWYSTTNQPFVYAGYSLFCAEVASTTNEVIVSRHMFAKEKDPIKRMHLLALQLEQIRGNVFRQVMFAEFELYIHTQVEQGRTPMADELCAKWHELNEKYYGEVLVVDAGIDAEWARVPHFYRDYYVYEYATGYAAASSFARMIMNGEEGVVERYKGFLKSGSSDDPIPMLRKAGVDLTTDKPFADVIAVFTELVDLLEAEYNSMKK